MGFVNVAPSTGFSARENPFMHSLCVHASSVVTCCLEYVSMSDHSYGTELQDVIGPADSTSLTVNAHVKSYELVTTPTTASLWDSKQVSAMYTLVSLLEMLSVAHIFCIMCTTIRFNGWVSLIHELSWGF